MKPFKVIETYERFVFLDEKECSPENYAKLLEGQDFRTMQDYGKVRVSRKIIPVEIVEKEGAK